MKLITILNDPIMRSEIFFDFEMEFHTGIRIEESTGNPAIGGYELPDELPCTKEDLLNLIRKSLADNHDYLLDFAKQHGKKIVYKAGCIY